MATVSALLVVITSGLVRDLYQKVIRPQASEREIRRVTYLTTLLVGVLAVPGRHTAGRLFAVAGRLATSGGGAGFLVPALMACYWRRATAAGALAAMLAGAGTVGALIIAGLFGEIPASAR